MPRIVLYPHPALRYVSRPLSQIDDELRGTVRSMFDLMYGARGIGLAANQVGLPFRFFILNLTADPAQPDQEQVFINPVIVKRHSTTEDEEGCLSFPGLFASVKRARKVRVKAYGLKGEEIDLEADDLLGRAIQHELDHLDGKLFVDYLSPADRATADAKIKVFEEAYRKAQAGGAFPSDEALGKRLEAISGPSLAAAQPEPIPELTTPSPASGPEAVPVD